MHYYIVTIEMSRRKTEAQTGTCRLAIVCCWLPRSSSTRRQEGRCRPGRSPSGRGCARPRFTTTSAASRRCSTQSSATASRSSCRTVPPAAWRRPPGGHPCRLGQPRRVRARVPECLCPHLRQRQARRPVRRHRRRSGAFAGSAPARGERDDCACRRPRRRPNLRRLLGRHPDADPAAPGERDLGLSERMRESVLATITDAAERRPTTRRSRRSSRSRPRSRTPSSLTAGERALMRELLVRLANES